MKAIEKIIQQELAAAIGRLGLDPQTVSIELERPKQEAHGDWSTNVAMKLAAPARKNPRQMAEAIREQLAFPAGLIDNIDIAGAGFINFFLGWGYYRQVLLDILQQGSRFGCADWGHGLRVQIEFVSANPTGPLNVVSARAATVGDVIANLYQTVGFQIDREYYVNDAGRQVRLLGASVSSRYMALFDREEEFPAEGYHGEYVKDLAREIATEVGDRFVSLSLEQRQEVLARLALERMVRSHQEMMTAFRVDFQNWFRESELRKRQAHLEVLRKLEEKGFVYQQDGASWFRSQQFGDEKDRVLVTSDGEPTYFLVDIAYHQNKYERGYDKIYDIWGPDHHGYIPRMKAALQALGYPKDSFEVEIVQQVNLLRGGEVVKMSKRAGQIIEMQELIDEVGVDAARFFFVNRKCSSHLDFDIDLAKKQSDENPVYYVQYAHARIFNIIKYAAEQGLRADISINHTGPDTTADLELLKQEEEKQLLRKLSQYPDVISKAAQFWEPHRLTGYLQELAATFHHFYHLHRVVTENLPLTRARLRLCQATQIVFANALKILGITAPERM
ncbi:MAG: arginine--tRNA ligase [candidate division KSB1 bacterium]|nr:arginine--tRNA ligase [candidate division KSB1 bacterium]MDZ7318524.1 arginine--tRNA ligase [candidate division KSB1 bacterium]MDZ7342171.1 arginine--tRNA ligase [candidate division KSB1 bacterium]